MQVLNFYSRIFADQLKRGRKTATIRVGDKSHKYRKNQAVMVTIGYQHSPRELVFKAVIDQVEVKRFRELSPRDIEHDNPEFRRLDEMVHFLEQIYGRKVEMDDTVTVVRFSQALGFEGFPELQEAARDEYRELRESSEKAMRVVIERDLDQYVNPVGLGDKDKGTDWQLLFNYTPSNNLTFYAGITNYRFATELNQDDETSQHYLEDRQYGFAKFSYRFDF